MAAAQLVEWLLLTPEIRGSNPVIGKFYLQSVLKRRKKKKEAGNCPFKKHFVHFAKTTFPTKV